MLSAIAMAGAFCGAVNWETRSAAGIACITVEIGGGSTLRGAFTALGKASITNIAANARANAASVNLSKNRERRCVDFSRRRLPREGLRR